jgi:membrane-bound lytic murein transglycosylase D
MRNNYIVLNTIICILFILPLPAYAEGPAEHFPCSPKMMPSVDFWKRIFTAVSTGEGLIHDRENLSVVYEIFPSPAEASPGRKKEIKSRLDYYAHQLGRLANHPDSRDPDLMKIAACWTGMNPDAQTYRAASQQVRFQRGQREKFLAGLKRSVAYLPAMKRILRREAVPEDLVYLPHVESSFNCQARSKAGAVGMWQFLASTGRKYLTINKFVDQRKDPLLSTGAAARLLRDNYDKLRSWPLALIAYNYGTNGMVRATEVHNTTDFEYILDNHKGKTFRFASRNFYAEFLAAREIAENPDRYFSEMRYVKNERTQKISPHDGTGESEGYRAVRNTPPDGSAGTVSD